MRKRYVLIVRKEAVPMELGDGHKLSESGKLLHNFENLHIQISKGLS